MKLLYKKHHIKGLLVLAVFILTAIVITFSIKIVLSKPASCGDWVQIISSNRHVNAGGFFAGDNLEDFIKIYRLKDSGRDSVCSWINHRARARYIYLQYSAQEDFIRAVSMKRVSQREFHARESSDLHYDYASIKSEIESHIRYLSEEEINFILLWSDRAEIKILYGSAGGYGFGKIVSLSQSGSVIFDFQLLLMSTYDVYPYTNRILSEDELVQLFRRL